LIVIEDGLSSNAPHIKDLEENNLHYILGAKEGDHRFLFDYVNEAAAHGKTTDLIVPDGKNPAINHYLVLSIMCLLTNQTRMYW